MDTQHAETLPDIAEATFQKSFGPAMRALTGLQRRFVIAMCETGGGNATLAYQMAGGQSQSRNSMAVAASRLLHNELILAALREEADRRIRAGALLGASALTEMALDVTHKDRFKAASALLAHAGLGIVAKSEITHVHKSDDEIILRIRELAKTLNLDAQKLLGNHSAPRKPVLIDDAEYSEVASTEEGLEDLL